MQENPLSSKLAPHAPTVEDRQIWQQTDQEQRQLWLRQTGGNSGPVVAAASGSSSSAIINVNTARDPQDWGPDDNHGGGGAEAEDVRNWEDGDELSPGVDGQQQNLRKYIAQMKEQYEEQFRKHQEELDRLRTEQETQLRILREQIKE
ncbi:hypothetical protein EC991_001550 [Linnemannia zychae]|nr:hypothetical protein EC991_001550 [Linnemannia zychae]